MSRHIACPCPISEHARTMRLLCCVLSVLLALEPAVSSLAVGRRYDSIFSFGDSFADTGNGLVVFAAHSLANPAAGPPYGSTFFGRPTGRNSNGRLIIDFIAAALGLPFVPPFLAHSGSFRQGANFAVAGATALDAGFFSFIPGAISRYIFNSSTSVQLRWFESLTPSLCHPSECKTFFHRSLFFMGELGVNDYSFSVFGKNLSEIRPFVPDVVKIISAATERRSLNKNSANLKQKIIKQGAKTVVVPGIPPMGCSPPNLTMFPSTDPADYDPRTGCLKQLNDLATYHNSLLQDAINNVQTKHPDVRVI